MNLKIYSIEELEKPDNFRWYHTANYSFVKRILTEKFPGSELIIVKDVQDIAGHINQSMRKLRDKMHMEMESYLDRKSNPNDVQVERGNNIETFEEFQERNISIRTEISGIVFPARHADWNFDMDRLLQNIEEPFKSGLDKEIKSFNSGKDVYWPFHRKDLMKFYSEKFHVSEDAIKEFLREAVTPTQYLDERDKAKGNYFYQRFHIPVFETWKFLPGYRIKNETIGESEGAMKDRMHYVEHAYTKWLDRNFKNDEVDFEFMK